MILLIFARSLRSEIRAILHQLLYQYGRFESRTGSSDE